MYLLTVDMLAIRLAAGRLGAIQARDITQNSVGQKRPPVRQAVLLRCLKGTNHAHFQLFANSF